MISINRLMPAILMLAAGIGGTAMAQAPARPAAPAGAPAVNLPGVSPQGNAALTRIARQDDPIARDAVTKLRALGPQVVAVANVTPLDIDKLAALLRQGDSLQATLLTRKTERLLAGLRAVSPGDRQAFLKAVSTPQAANQPR